MFPRMVVMGLVATGVTVGGAETSPPPSKLQGPSVKLEHAVAMFKLRGGGNEEAAVTGLTKVPAARLVILPATSHIAISGEAKVLESMVTPFLDDAPPANPSLW